MEAFRRSLSFQKHRRSSSESQLIGSSEIERESIETKPRSSLDTFVIPHRTRYPSNNIPPSTIDLHVAASLLSRTISEPSNPFSDSRTDLKPTAKPNYAEHFNDIATQVGLTTISSQDHQDSTSTSQSPITPIPGKSTVKKTLFQRLSRKHSVSAIASRESPKSIKSSTLDDVCRLGGVSIFGIPLSSATANLVVPTALAATGEYLVKHGRETSGIFRIPGQTTVVNALYNYYKARMSAAEDSKDVEATIGSISLPADVNYNVHDVASAYKRFLWDLPGGILGSVALFRSLSDIGSIPEHTIAAKAAEGEHILRPKLIALALLTMTSETRFALVCAVFGLLAYLKQDNNAETLSDTTNMASLSPEAMSSQALGVVFAPILLGNLTDEIEFHDGRKNSGSGNNLNTPKRGILTTKKLKKLKSSDCGPEIAAGVSRATAAASVVELLVRNWSDIARQIVLLRARPTSRSMSHSSRGQSGRTSRSGFVDVPPRAFHRPSVPHMRARRTHSLSKSISDPNLMVFSSASQQSLGTSATSHDAVCPSRSVSVTHGSSAGGDSRAVSGTRNFSYSSSALQSISETRRWPILQPSTDRRPIRSSESSGHSLAWWERGSSDNTGNADADAAMSEPRSSPVDEPQSTYSRFADTGDVVAETPSGSVRPFDANERSDGTPRNRDITAGPGVDATSEPMTKLDMAQQHALQNDLPAPHSLIKMLSPSGSLDSVLSRNHRQDPTSMARSSYRSLHSSGSRQAVRPGPWSGAAESASKSKQPRQAASSASLVPRASPSNTAVRRTPRPTPSPGAPILPEHSTGSGRPRRTPITNARAFRNEHHSSPVVQAHAHSSPGSKREQHAKSEPLHSRVEDTARRIEQSRLFMQGLHQSDDAHHYHHHTNRDHQELSRDSTSTRPDAARVRAPRGAATLLPFPHEPAVARRIQFRASADPQPASRTTSDEYASGTELSHPNPNHKPNIGTLHAEIRRLQHEVDNRNDEVVQMRHRLDAVQRFRDSGTLSEKLRETEREMRYWQTRAVWAENQLFSRFGGERERGGGGSGAGKGRGE